MAATRDGHWDTLHTLRPQWYRCVWRACAALEDWVTQNAEGNGQGGQAQLPSREVPSAAVRIRTSLYELAQEQKVGMDTRSLLLLALEDPALAEASPASFDAVRQHMHAAYLLREQFAQDLAGELAHYWEDREAGLPFASLPLPAKLVAQGAGPPPHPILRIVRLAVKAFAAWRTGIRREPGSPFPRALSMVVQGLPATLSKVHARIVGYPLTWSQRMEKVRRVFDDLLTRMAQQEGEPPAEIRALYVAKECADEATYGGCDTRSLLLLALEMPWLAEDEPENYEVLQADQQNGEVGLSAAYLISENVYLAILAALEDRLGEWRRAYWSVRADGCLVCGEERGDSLWAPFAGLPFTFTPLDERPADPQTRLALRIGQECRHTLEYGGTIAFSYDGQPFCANRTRGVYPVEEDRA